jgi:hypothetical protein
VNAVAIAAIGVVGVCVVMLGTLALRRRQRHEAAGEREIRERVVEPRAVGPVSVHWCGAALVHMVGGRPVASMSRAPRTASAWEVLDLARRHARPQVVGSESVARAACWGILDEARHRHRWWA